MYLTIPIDESDITESDFIWKSESDFRVAFYCGQPKAHLCNNHAV